MSETDQSSRRRLWWRVLLFPFIWSLKAKFQPISSVPVLALHAFAAAPFCISTMAVHWCSSGGENCFCTDGVVLAFGSVHIWKVYIVRKHARLYTLEMVSKGCGYLWKLYTSRECVALKGIYMEEACTLEEHTDFSFPSTQSVFYNWGWWHGPRLAVWTIFGVHYSLLSRLALGARTEGSQM